MKTNIVDALERNARAGKKCIEPKSRLAMLLLVCVALAVGACETLDLESNNPVEPVGGQPYYAGYTRESGFAAGLSGRWYHDGQPTSISVEADGRNVTIINEHGRRSSGYAASHHELEIPSLHIRGHVSHNGQRISWTNGTEWTRGSYAPGPAFGAGVSGPGVGAGLSGRWYHDGQPTSISVSSDGRNVTIINEQGQRASGYMSGNHELVISSLGIRGHVGHGGRRIAWANGHRVDPLIEDKAINRTFGFLTLSPLSVKLGQP